MSTMESKKNQKFDFGDKSKIISIMTAKSENRFRVYMNECNQDKISAFKLYHWNGIAGAAFYVPLQATEVVLRTAMYGSLKSSFGANWFDQDELKLDKKSLERIKEAKIYTDFDSNYPERLIPHLSFGFWVKLLSKGGLLPDSNQHANFGMTLWVPALRKIFPKEFKRREVYKILSQLLTLRNRIAHHEPIFNRDLAGDFDNILLVLSWFSPETKEWIESTSTVLEILSQRDNI